MKEKYFKIKKLEEEIRKARKELEEEIENRRPAWKESKADIIMERGSYAWLLAQDENGEWWYTDAEYFSGAWSSVYNCREIDDPEDPEPFGKEFGKEIELPGFKKAYEGQL